MEYVHLVEQLPISLDQKFHIKIIYRVNLFTIGSYQKFWASVSFDSELPISLFPHFAQAHSNCVVTFPNNI